MSDIIKTSINEAEGLKALKALVGSRFVARNDLVGNKNLFLYMAGDLVTLTGINMRKRRVCMCNKQGLGRSKANDRCPGAHKRAAGDRRSRYRGGWQTRQAEAHHGIARGIQAADLRYRDGITGPDVRGRSECVPGYLKPL